MPEDEALGELVHLNDPILDGLDFGIVDKYSRTELLMDGGTNQQTYYHVFLLVFGYDGCADYCLAHVDIHIYLFIFA
jgi:hypothetical protein